MAGWKRLSHAANTECSFYWDKPFPSRPTTGRKPEARTRLDTILPDVVHSRLGQKAKDEGVNP